MSRTPFVPESFTLEVTEAELQAMEEGAKRDDLEWLLESLLTLRCCGCETTTKMEGPIVCDWKDGMRRFASPTGWVVDAEKAICLCPACSGAPQ